MTTESIANRYYLTGKQFTAEDKKLQSYNVCAECGER